MSGPIDEVEDEIKGKGGYADTAEQGKEEPPDETEQTDEEGCDVDVEFDCGHFGVLAVRVLFRIKGVLICHILEQIDVESSVIGRIYVVIVVQFHALVFLHRNRRLAQQKVQRRENRPDDHHREH